ncbi:MAG: sensor histidine kinase [Chloroflexota bacterium]|nr:sensor histidine kinase [Chloroflexota bacterium]
MTILPLTAGLWLGYLLLLLAIDHLLYPRPVLPLSFYSINGLIALAVLGLALWPRGRTWLGQAFVPLVVVLLSVTPVVLAQVIALQHPSVGPASGPEAVLLRIMPLLLMALILLVWQYGWRYAILFSGGIALFSLGLHLYFYRPEGPSLLPPMTVLLIQTITFLLVGYFISVLVQQLRRQNESLEQANAQLADYAATLEELTISRERNRMARELHDTLAHTLSALSVQLETVKAYWEVDPTAVQPMLDKALTATRSGLQETRRALKSLRASPLDDLGLSLALRQLATETAQRANLHLDLSVPEHLPSLTPAVEQCIYRVAQEAAANAVHHANAHRLTVRLAFNGGVSLQVSDDGRGFDPRQAESAGHFGLSGMRERAQLVGGDLSISSHPGGGTTIQLTIALDK